ncbi:DUF5916 domain-containing protein [Corallococcus sp. AB045]|uniref:DUF5916 domain-containing protein n=1 Tax=Corallococcus sp. AB045 TaxID=2316719 RepID=UPI0013157CF8|nr:DUF5916 domain-containing protein [Corallococcus sp. AB045]
MSSVLRPRSTAPVVMGLLTLLWASSPRAEGPPASSAIQARRTLKPIQLDGRLDEAEWALAPLFDRFVQTFPKNGAAPSERTDLRVLYDDDNLYVGILARDSQPLLINRQLGRRDRPPESDSVTVMVDSAHDHRTAYAFTVNAGGILRDVLYFEDIKYTEDWDAVWDGAAADLPDGWSAELVIPLHLLRFPEAPTHTFGLAVRRNLARTREVIDSTLLPRNDNAFVSRFGHLEGLERIPSRGGVQLTPYVAARFGMSPRYADPARPSPRLGSPSADVGVDLRAALTSDLTLTATVNPDFGQVEADQLILNLSTFEQFFPEKRPFFLQGMDVFQPVGDSSQTLFYTRRIGLQTPILAAVKLTGNLTDTLQVGVLDAVVMGPSAPRTGLVDADGEALPDRRIRFHPSRPLHLGPNNELPAQAGAAQNFLTVVLRQQPVTGVSVGGTFAAATPLSDLCAGILPSDPEERDACRVAGGNAAALDWDVRSTDGAWGVRGQLTGSRVAGGPEAGRPLRDGTLLRPGDLGLGAYVSGGKQGGEPFRFDVGYEYLSPRLELSTTGYQPSQNVQEASGRVSFVRPTGFGPLLDFSTSVQGITGWTTDGRGIRLSHKVTVGALATLPGFHAVECELGQLTGRSDIREIPLTGIPYERPPYRYAACAGSTDKNRALSFQLDGYVGRISAPAPLPSKTGGGGAVTMTWRPTPRLETQLTSELLTNLDGPRYVGDEDGRLVFGQLHPRAMSFTLRQLLVLTPRLTLQAYAQFFSAYGRYGPFFEGTPDTNGRLPLARLTPTTTALDPDFHESALNLNAVLRWEYRLGSTLYFVYSRAQTELPTTPGTAQVTRLAPNQLLDGATTDTWLLKWSHQWGL